MATTPRPTSQNSGSGNSFTATPSTRAISFVAVALLIGFLLVLIVDSDKDNQTSTATKQETTVEETTTTVTQATEVEETQTTTKPVSGTKDPAEVSVLILNGSNVSGVAGKVTTAISELDYETLTAGDDSSKDTGTFVYYKSGFENDAKQLATNVVPGILKTLKITQSIKTAQFPSSAPSQWDQDNLIGANVVIVIGNVAS